MSMRAQSELTPTLDGIADRPVLARRIPQIRRKDRGKPKLFLKEDRFHLHNALKGLTGISPEMVIDAFFGEDDEQTD